MNGVQKADGRSMFFWCLWLLFIHADLQFLELEAGVFTHALGFHNLDIGLHQLVDQVLPHLPPRHRFGVTQTEHTSVKQCTIVIMD